MEAGISDHVWTLEEIVNLLRLNHGMIADAYNITIHMPRALSVACIALAVALLAIIFLRRKRR
jgi:hypothetical protein